MKNSDEHMGTGNTRLRDQGRDYRIQDVYTTLGWIDRRSSPAQRQEKISCGSGWL